MKSASTKKPVVDVDVAPELDESFFRRAIHRKAFEPISAGPDAPDEFKAAVAAAKAARVPKAKESKLTTVKLANPRPAPVQRPAMKRGKAA